MSKYQEIKEELKALAKQIKSKRIEYKEAQRNNKLTWRIISDLDELVYQFRHRHIAMSIIRGRLREEIEKPGRYNLPNEHYIADLVEEYEKILQTEMEDHEQTLRSDS